MGHLETIRELKHKLDTETRTHGKAALEELCMSVFDAAPEVEAIVWAQYAPYFNDGDPCEFSVHGVEFKLKAGTFSEAVEATAPSEYKRNADDPFPYHYEDDCDIVRLTGNGWRKGAERARNVMTKDELLKAKRLERIRDEFSLDDLEDVLKVVLGSDCKVVATRKGIETEEWSHD